MRPRFAHFAHVVMPLTGEARQVHRHPVHELLVVVSGRYEVQVDGRRLVAGPSDILHYPAGLEHLPQPKGRRLDLYVVQYHEQGPAPVTRPRLVRNPGGRALAWCDRFEDLRSRAGPRIRRARDSLLDLLLLELDVAGVADETPLVRAARNAVYGNLARHLGVAALARFAGLSRRQFVRRFTAEAGCGPAEYETRLRTEQALILLDRTDLCLDAVAERTGISSRSHLHRLVVRTTGRPPGSHRRRERQGFRCIDRSAQQPVT